MAVDCPIPDTGQTKCYDDSQEITCPSTGEPFYGQDAQYAPCNPHSYTKLDENGNDLPDSAIEWVMVRDNVTGLVWENKTDDGSIHDKDNTYNWQDAQDVFIATLNSQNFGGYSDWRLPSVNELQSIVDYSRHDPAINADYFPNTESSGYRSSTTSAGSPNYAWVVNFFIGSIFDGYKSGYNYYVRAVRSGQCGSFDTSTTTTVPSTTTTISGSTTTTISGSTTTTVQPCPTEQIYGDHSAQTELLRYLRDNILSTTPEGQEIIRLYYEWSPVIVEMMNGDEEFKAQVQEVIDGVLEVIGE